VGSLALGGGNRWSDLDLTPLAVADSFSIFDVLEDWTPNLVEAFDVVHLFDLPSGAGAFSYTRRSSGSSPYRNGGVF
jgi:hypothetical protein